MSESPSRPPRFLAHRLIGGRALPHGWWVLPLLALALLVVTRPARAAECGTKFERLLYVADFRAPLDEPVVAAADAADLSLRVGTDAQGQTRALISGRRDGTCRATCRVKGLERDARNRPISLDMECRDAGLRALRVPATLIWAEGSALAWPSLRFGSWLQGYQHARLRVTLDRYGSTPPRLAPKSTGPTATRARLGKPPRHGWFLRRRSTRMYA
jgi:hypothetical protein